MKRIKKRPTGILFIILVLGVALIALSRTGYLNLNIWGSTTSLAERILKTCSLRGQPEQRQECYGQEVTKLMDPPRNLSMKDAFQIAKVIQNNDYPFCHVLGHEIAQKQVRKDPSKWKDVITACPRGICANGCSHGVLMEKYKFDYLTEQQVNDIMPDLKTVCAKRETWNPPLIEQSLCYHGLGHLSMYLTKASVKRAADMCDRIALGDLNFKQMCYDGAFMQIFQHLDDDDYALVKDIKPKKKDITSFCNQYPPMQRLSCLTESWPLFHDLILMPTGIIPFCQRVGPENDPLTMRCYDGIFRIMTIQFQFDTQKISQYCFALSSQKGGFCFASAASSLIEDNWDNADQVIALCETALWYGLGDVCYQTIVSRVSYNFPAGSNEHKKFCSKLPKRWQSACHSQGSARSAQHVT